MCFKLSLSDLSSLFPPSKKKKLLSSLVGRPRRHKPRRGPTDPVRPSPHRSLHRGPRSRKRRQLRGAQQRPPLDRSRRNCLGKRDADGVPPLRGRSRRVGAHVDEPGEQCRVHGDLGGAPGPGAEGEGEPERRDFFVEQGLARDEREQGARGGGRRGGGLSVSGDGGPRRGSRVERRGQDRLPGPGEEQSGRRILLPCFFFFRSSSPTPPPWPRFGSNPCC